MTVPLVYDTGAEIYKKNGANFASISHLETIGLIKFSGLTGYEQNELGKKINAEYVGKKFVLEFSKEADNKIPIGKVLLTETGKSLASITQPESVEGLVDYVTDRWKAGGISINLV